MTRKTRRITFYLFVAIFFLATPPIILYSMGYSYDFENSNLVQTGGLYLKSLPAQTEIFINEVSEKTAPRLISHLSPGNYNITIVKDGFFSWQKTLPVSAKLVTEARNILLLPKTITPELIAENVTSTIPNFLLAPKDKADLSLAQKTASTSAAWIYTNNNLYFLSSTNYILYRTDLNNLFKEQLSKTFIPTQHYRIIAKDNSHIALLSDKGEVYLLNRDMIFEKIAEGAKDVQFSPDGKKLLWLTENEIWVQWLQELLIQPYRQAGDRELITRFAQPISQAIFSPDNEHVSFVVNGQIKVTELDGRDKRNTIDFLSAKDPQMYFDNSENYFYWLTENKLYRMKMEF